MPHKAWVAWSSGKDSAWALHLANASADYEIVGLLTTVSEEYRRVSMHGVREELAEAQAQSLRLPLCRLSLPSPCPPETYDALMRAALAQAAGEGVTHVIFGDLFLEDVRRYRAARTAEAGLTAVFPLWALDTNSLARQMIDAGLRAILTCVDPSKAPRETAGREFDERLLASLPATVDACGENGEFHTFVWAGPMFSDVIKVTTGETVEHDGFVFTDLLQVEASSGDVHRHPLSQAKKPCKPKANTRRLSASDGS